ncbi:Peroxisomal fatty acid beta-oxidation multifunctional protein AIM1 [Platanthera zijinensis]|uniref:Peroxisomal fatty acid beta-oxidation multifunctional protein AIM1 n=1 Tax=Platanthera zijinensis TaxID=2320716 RepID=A0AAP0G599_9ASPA
MTAGAAAVTPGLGWFTSTWVCCTPGVLSKSIRAKEGKECGVVDAIVSPMNLLMVARSWALEIANGSKPWISSLKRTDKLASLSVAHKIFDNVLTPDLYSVSLGPPGRRASLGGSVAPPPQPLSGSGRRGYYWPKTPTQCL